jgi:hypothetical protein
MGVSLSRYLAGGLVLLVIGGALGWCALLFRRRLLAGWSGAPARLAELVMAFALLTWILELVGAVGLFALAPMVVVLVAVAAATHWRLGRRPRAVAPFTPGAGVPGPGLPGPGLPGPAPGPGPALALAGLATAVVLAEWAGPTLAAYSFGVRTFDSLWYHLPWAASFVQSGQITPLHFTDVEYLTAFYPATAELFHGLGMLLFGGDLLSPGLNLVWVALALLAAYCVGQPFGVGALTLLGAAVAMATPMMDISQAGSAANDVVGVFFVLAAAALVVAGRERPGQDGRRATALAGLSAGLAVSVKLSMLAAVVALTVGVLVLPPRGSRRATAGLWLGPLLLTGGFWYLRNLIVVGNPLPWLDVPGLATPAAPLQAHTGFSVAHYLFASRPWHGILEPGLASGLGPWWWAVLAAVVLGPLLCLLPGAGATVRMLGLVALACTAAYVLTPESAAGPSGHPLGFAFNLRYSAPALTLSLVVLPLAPALRSRRGRWLGAAVLGILLVTVVSGARLWPARHLTGQLALGAAVLIGVGLGAWGRIGTDRRRWRWRWRRRGGPRRRAPAPAVLAALAAFAVLAVLAVGLGYEGQRHYFRVRYVTQPGISSLSRVWAFFRTVRDARVGVVGTYGGFFAYPLYGLYDSNRVVYLGARGPHGSFTAIGSCSRWRAAVNAARVRYLVTTPARDPWRPRVLSASPERGWTVGDPAARLVLEHRAAGQPVSVFALSGPLHPSRCPG